MKILVVTQEYKQICKSGSPLNRAKADVGAVALSTGVGCGSGLFSGPLAPATVPIGCGGGLLWGTVTVGIVHAWQLLW